jgi:hypothetical protein
LCFARGAASCNGSDRRVQAIEPAFGSSFGEHRVGALIAPSFLM